MTARPSSRRAESTSGIGIHIERGERMQDGFVVLVKKRMIEKGRDDFVSYLAEILGITKQGASKKLNGKTRITRADMAKIDSVLDLDAEGIKAAL